MRDSGCPIEPGQKSRVDPGVVMSRKRAPLTRSNVRRRVPIDVASVYRDVPPRVLQQASAAEAHDAAANDSHIAGYEIGRLPDCQRRRSPAQAQAAPAVAVIVDDGLAVEAFPLDPEAGGPVGPVAHDDADDGISRYAWCSPGLT